MTQPTGRRTASQITDTELDQLYAERDELGREADRLFKAAAEQHARAEQAEDLLRVAHETSNTSEAERAKAVQRAERAEGELLRSVNARETLCADRNAAEQRAERADAERDQAWAAIRSALPDLRRAVDCLDATCRYHGDRLDPDEYGRRYRAEACCDTGIEPRRAREARQTLDRLRAALDEQQEPT